MTVEGVRRARESGTAQGQGATRDWARSRVGDRVAKCRSAVWNSAPGTHPNAPSLSLAGHLLSTGTVTMITTMDQRICC